MTIKEFSDANIGGIKMGSNPIQRQKRVSLLVGLIIGLVIGLALCGVLYWFMSNNKNVSLNNGETLKQVAVLKKAVKSGNNITMADITVKNVSSGTVPVDAVSISDTVVAKVDLAAGTVLSSSLITTADSKLTKDLRQQEYNMISLPSQLASGDFIDVRFELPDGGDYIVISKKRVQNANGTTVWLNMNEEEILTMSNAIIEFYIMTGSKLYATRYTDPGAQEAAIPTYTPNATVTSLISANENITSQIADGQGRFSERLKSMRNSRINTQLSQYSDQALSNLEKGIQDELTALKESRQAYFGTLNATN